VEVVELSVFCENYRSLVADIAFLFSFYSRDPQHQLVTGLRNESVEEILQRKYRTYFHRKSNCLDLYDYLRQGECSEHWRRLRDWSFCSSFWVCVCTRWFIIISICTLTCVF